MKTLFNSGSIVRILTAGSVCILFGLLTVRAEIDAATELPDSVHDVYISYLEEIIDELEEDDADQLIDFLESLRAVPVDINTVTRSDLRAFPFLTESDIELLLNARRQGERFNKLADLYDISGIDVEKIHLLVQFIYIDEHDVRSTRIRPNVTVRSHISNELHERRGYREDHYLGSPLATDQRILFGLTPNIQAGILVAKSAGEHSITGRRSGYLAAALWGNRVRLAAGDYRLHFGQGLLLGSGFGFAKGGNPARGVVHRSGGVRPAASRSEHHRFRGGAVSFNFPSTEAVLFYSLTPRAATVHDDGTVQTLLSYPVYRTELDSEKRNALTETLYGAHVRQLFFQSVTIGVTWYGLEFNREFKPAISERFAGTGNDHIGFDWSVHYRRFHLFGEAASRLPVNNPAVVTGLLVPVAHGIDASILYRYYPPEYTSKYGFPFAERRGSAEDERGLYFGVRIRPAPRHLIEGYFDVYSFSNKNRSPALPVNGTDAAVRVEYPVNNTSILETRIRRRVRPVPVVEQVGGTDERILLDRLQNNYRVRITTNPHSSFRLRLHYEYVSVSYPEANRSESGSYLAADIRWNLLSAMSITARSVVFGTDSFDSRLYTAEYDMPGRVRMIMLNGRGSHVSFGLQYTVFDAVTISAKYYEQFRSDGETIGSGFQEIDGPALGVVMFQIDARL